MATAAGPQLGRRRGVLTAARHRSGSTVRRSALLRAVAEPRRREPGRAPSALQARAGAQPGCARGATGGAPGAAQVPPGQQRRGLGGTVGCSHALV